MNNIVSNKKSQNIVNDKHLCSQARRSTGSRDINLFHGGLVGIRLIKTHGSLSLLKKVLSEDYAVVHSQDKQKSIDLWPSRKQKNIKGKTTKLLHNTGDIY